MRYRLRHAQNQSLLVLVWCMLFFGIFAQAQEEGAVAQTITIQSGVPLHIRVTRTTDLRVGAPVEGLLTEPVYVYDRLVLPGALHIRGTVSAVIPAERKLRTQALLNGDVTPLHDPVVNFNSIQMGEQEIAISSQAFARSTQLVNFVPAGPRPSLMHQAKAMVADRIQSARTALFGPGKKDRALRLLYGQLPYHPQRIWVDTQFIADLNAPAQVSLPAEPKPKIALATPSTLDTIVVTGRLTGELNSDVAKKGDAVGAVVTRPVFNAKHELVVSEGTRLEGEVLQTQASRSFGRNGQLRFVFRSVQLPQEEAQPMHGTLTGAEGNSAQNLSVDHEGTVRSHPDKNRFLAPLVLGVLAAAGHDSDDEGDLGRNTVASNGFGLVARIITLTINNRNVATGFATYAFAKSIYFRFLARGHAVTFPRDTLVLVQLQAR